MPPEKRRERRAAILLVDDTRSARVLGEQILRRHGFQVISVESADDALRALDEWSISCIVSDLHMPGGDGVSLLEAVGAWFHTARILWSVDEGIGKPLAHRLGIPFVSKHDPPVMLVDAIRDELGLLPPGAA